MSRQQLLPDSAGHCPSTPATPPCFLIADFIAAEIEMSQRWAARLATPPIDYNIAEIEVSERSALPEHSCKTLCPACSNAIVGEIEVN